MAESPDPPRGQRFEHAVQSSGNGWLQPPRRELDAARVRRAASIELLQDLIAKLWIAAEGLEVGQEVRRFDSAPGGLSKHSHRFSVVRNLDALAFRQLFGHPAKLFLEFAGRNFLHVRLIVGLSADGVNGQLGGHWRSVQPCCLVGAEAWGRRGIRSVMRDT